MPYRFRIQNKGSTISWDRGFTRQAINCRLMGEMAFKCRSFLAYLMLESSPVCLPSYAFLFGGLIPGSSGTTDAQALLPRFASSQIVMLAADMGRFGRRGSGQAISSCMSGHSAGLGVAGRAAPCPTPNQPSITKKADRKASPWEVGVIFL